MSDRWEFYFARVNDALASIFFDVDAINGAPDADRPWLLWVWLYLRKPRADGLSDAEEAPLLHDIEDALQSAVRDKLNGILVGRITTSGRREFYFYSRTADGFTEITGGVLARFPEYRIDAGTNFDQGWSQYLDVLYPGSEEWQRIKNRPVIEHLASRGDRHEIPRRVFHWAYFSDQEKCEGFIRRIAPLGFTVLGRSNTGDGANRYGVQFERTDKVEQHRIDEVTVELYRMAVEAGGEYDGWETSVEAG